MRWPIEKRATLVRVVAIVVGVFFASENFVLYGEKLIERRAFGERSGSLAGMGYGQQCGLVVNATDEHLGPGHEEAIFFLQ